MVVCFQVCEPELGQAFDESFPGRSMISKITILLMRDISMNLIKKTSKLLLFLILCLGSNVVFSASTNAGEASTLVTSAGAKESKIQDIWDTLQPLLVKYNEQTTYYIWDTWSDKDWQIKEAIISWRLTPGKGEVWTVDMSFGDFLAAYLKDYTHAWGHEDYRHLSSRQTLVNLVGQIVPALYGAHSSLGYDDIVNLLDWNDGYLSKAAERTDRALRERLAVRFGMSKN